MAFVLQCNCFSATFTLVPEFVCYDDGCHYAKHPCRSQLTPYSSKLADTEIVIDKMHMRRHTDPWCHKYCDPKSFRELDNVSLSKFTVWLQYLL